MRGKTQHPTISKPERQIKGKFAPRRPKPRKEEAEFGPGKTDILAGLRLIEEKIFGKEKEEPKK
ncbi:unnamed protein product [marine sediment metagenome]|uniref:Uncharacterized protein n=1 Tax=marine sediment metagenome TaxID=412755 RepID=X1MGE9_9ZZZZ